MVQIIHLVEILLVYLKCILSSLVDLLCRTINQAFINGASIGVGEIVIHIITAIDLDRILSLDGSHSYAVSNSDDIANIFVNITSSYFKTNYTFTFRNLCFYLSSVIGFMFIVLIEYFLLFRRH
jgi:hypothetical protein